MFILGGICLPVAPEKQRKGSQPISWVCLAKEIQLFPWFGKTISRY